MKTAPAVDVMEWIYELTKDVQIGSVSSSGGSAYGRNNHNFTARLREPVTVALGADEVVELPVDSEVAVFTKLTRTSAGVLLPPTETLATIFIKRGGRTVEQISIRAGGRIARRRL